MYLLMTVPGRPVSMDGHRNSNVVADFNQNTDRLRPAVVADQETVVAPSLNFRNGARIHAFQIFKDSLTGSAHSGSSCRGLLSCRLTVHSVSQSFGAGASNRLMLVVS